MTTLISLVLYFLVRIVGVFYVWNWIMPVLFSIKPISMWEAFGLVMLSAFLFSTPTESVIERINEEKVV